MMKLGFILFNLLMSQSDTIPISYGDSNLVYCDSTCDLRTDLKDGFYQVFDDYLGHKYLRIQGEIKNQSKNGVWKYWASYEEISYFPNAIRDSIRNAFENDPKNDGIELGILACFGGCDSTYLSKLDYYEMGHLKRNVEFLYGQKWNEVYYNNKGKESKVVSWGFNSSPLIIIEQRKRKEIFIGYYEDGKMRSKSYYDKNNNPIRKWIYFHPNGQKKAKGRILFDEFFGEKKKGRWKLWDENGKLIEIKNYSKE